MEWFLAIAQYLDAINNYIQTGALLVGIGTVLYMMFRGFAEAIHQILGQVGIPRLVQLRALFICRNNPVIKRAFIEFSILKTRGQMQSRRDWTALVNEFRRFYQESPAAPVYTLENCTSLLGAEFSQLTELYFDYFSQPRHKKRYGLPEDVPISWVIRIQLNEGYLTPTFLLTGLLSRYEENWNTFINKFVNSTYTAQPNAGSPHILPQELYFTFAWLLWGPSYALQDQEEWLKLCQLSYGDESNSVPVLLGTHEAEGDRLSRLWEQITRQDSSRFGALIKSTCSLYDCRQYLRYHCSEFSPANRYFVNHIQNGDLPFLLHLDEYQFFDNYKSKRYYCTAYVWIMFEMTNPQDAQFSPENSIAFFEHANLADRENYNFLIDTLIEKSCLHFSRIFSDPQYDGRIYRLVIGMNREIENRFIQRWEALCQPQWEDRLILSKSYTEAEVFTAFDEFFAVDDTYTVEEVDPADPDTLARLGEFYARIYIQVFPDVNERESFDNLLLTLSAQQNHQLPDCTYHIFLLKDEEGAILGGIIFDYLHQVNCGVIEFIAIAPNRQASGIGTLLYNAALKQLQQDAHRVNHTSLEYVVCEIDNPCLLSDDHPMAYYFFWKKQLFRRAAFSYIQPPLSPDKDAVTHLWLIISSLRKGAADAMPSETLKHFLREYIRCCMRIERPEDTAEYRRMCEEIDRIGQSVPLAPMPASLPESSPQPA